MSYEYMAGLGTNNGEHYDYDFATEATSEEQQSILEKAEDALRTFFYPEQSSSNQEQPMPGATASGQPTAEGFSEYTKEAAVRAGAAAEDEILPVQELPGDEQEDVEQRTWIERYQTHITIASTVIGLGTFVIWLIVRKK